MTMTESHRPSGLPDTDYHVELYEDVPSKRLFAWVLDTVLISLIVFGLSMLGAFLPLLFWTFFYAVVSFFYRWLTIAGRSATPGMRFMAIELRDNDGGPLSRGTALLHTLGYFVSVVTVPLQLVSIVMMLTTPRRQGLTDMILGTAAVNRRVL